MADQASSVDLSSLLEEFRIIVEPALREQDIGLSIEVQPDLPLVWADRQSLLQVLLNLFVFGQDVQSGIEAPRFATYSFPSSFAPYDYYPGRLAVEGRTPEPVIAELVRRGHEIQRWPDWSWTAGAVCAILADRRRGVLEAGADPRRAAYAIGW